MSPSRKPLAVAPSYGLPMALRPGQRRAVHRLLEVIRGRAPDGTHDSQDTRVQYHAATGSGKTLVSRVLSEEIGATLMGFGAPRIDLLGQAFEDYRRVTARPLDAVVVCSAPEIRDARGFPPGTLVTTNAAELRARLALPVPQGALRVVFFTYQSSRKLVRSLEPGRRFDLLVLDEAHRVARRESAYAMVWDGSALPASVRLALTATPLPEMAATGVFGVVADQYSVGDGILDGVLCDYRVQVLGVSDRATVSLLEAEPDRRTIAVADALLSEIAAGHMKRVLTFHRRRVDAARFVRVARQVSATRGVVVPTLLAQSGLDSPRARVTALRRLESIGGLIASPRIYLEGTDVRAIDTVAFIDPKSSSIDISQGIGRALRVNPADPGKVAQIVIPVAVSPEEAVAAALDASEFRRVWDVLRVLAAQDPRLAETLDRSQPVASRRRLGFPDGPTAGVGAVWSVSPSSSPADHGVSHDGSSRGFEDRSSEGSDAHPGGNVEGAGDPSGAAHDFLDAHLVLAGLVRDLSLSVTLRAAEEVGDQRARDIALVAAYAEQAGTTLVPPTLVLADGYPLGQRVQRLRQAYRSGRLPPDLIAAAERIPSWAAETGPRSPVAELWPRLLAYEAQHGHTAVPTLALVEDGFPLGERVEALRQAYRTGALEAAAVAQCQALAGWSWDLAMPTQYLRALPLLREFVRVFGHARVPSPADWPLRRQGRDVVEAVAVVRTAYAAGTLHSGDARALEREFNLPWTAPPLTPGLRRKILATYPEPNEPEAPLVQPNATWAVTPPEPRRQSRRGDRDAPPAPKLRLDD